MLEEDLALSSRSVSSPNFSLTTPEGIEFYYHSLEEVGAPASTPTQQPPLQPRPPIPNLQEVCHISPNLKKFLV
jgi:hypothetical protein